MGVRAKGLAEEEKVGRPGLYSAAAWAGSRKALVAAAVVNPVGAAEMLAEAVDREEERLRRQAAKREARRAEEEERQQARQREREEEEAKASFLATLASLASLGPKVVEALCEEKGRDREGNKVSSLS